jgi:hypothetical protein
MIWAKEIIDELRQKDLAESCDAVINFIKAYQDEDDEMIALNNFEATAEVHDTYEFYPSGNHYYFYIFADGSVYYDGKEGIDRFYPSISDLADEDDDFKNWILKEE